MKPRYSIGIDLGTTNCALSFVDLSVEGAESQVLSIPQFQERNTVVDREVLPSFLAWEGAGEWTPGLFARNRSRETPDRVIHSAKSWLCHHAVSPESKILPWNSPVVASDLKLSPIEASSRLLRFVREAWEKRFGSEAPFVSQIVTITVPASFDAAAQAATLEAAKQAGFPSQVRLIEEPQAAFYRWWESAKGQDEEAALQPGETVLVVDVGGGTSDFSFFKVGEASKKEDPHFERLAVSDHLLLGGDNIDLALAHALESELAPDGEELSVDQWGHLISRARELKERCLAQAEDVDEQAVVSLPSRGSGLFAGAVSAEISTLQAREMLLEGFFPDCSASVKAERGDAGLLEWGLPYAVDCAVTHHLAEFLAGKDRVNNVLFNGGSLSPRMLQRRLATQIGGWQGGNSPRVLENAETDLAVARGAACFGASTFLGETVIEAGAARSVFLEVGSEAGSKWVCVLPKGARPGESFVLSLEGLRLRLNQRARFQVSQAPDSVAGVAGAIFEGTDSDEFRALPALEAEIEGSDDLGETSQVAVRIVANVNELGLVTVSCEELEGDGVWPLAFNLRGESPSKDTDDALVAPSTTISREKIEKAGRRLSGQLRAGEKASRIFKELEGLMRLRKHEWDLGFSREMADVCLDSTSVLERGGAFAESWLQLTGYLMRPGFGALGDEGRIVRIEESLGSLPKLTAQLEVQSLILLRRIAAGMEEATQAALFDGQLDRLASTKRATDERVRLLGSLEKLDLGRKQSLFDVLMERLDRALEEDAPVVSLLAGLAGLASRFLFHAGPDRVLPPDFVQSIYSRLKKEAWEEGRFAGAIPLFLSAARVVDDRTLDVPSRLCSRIAKKLEKSGVAPARLAPLQDYVPLSREDRVQAFGETLPPGLVLA